MVGNRILILFLMFFFLISADSAAAGQSRGRAGEKTIQFDDLQLSVNDDPGHNILGGGYVLKFSRKGKVVYTGDCAFRVHDPKIYSGMPGPDCRSLLAYCFSGGAHCCMSLIIATDCGSQKALNVVDLTHSGSGVKFVDTGTGSAKALKVTDWQFAYYNVENSELQLSFADSPGMSRLVVFEGGRWRVDRVGEFGRFYDGLLKATRHSVKLASGKGDETELAAGRAIKAAYYSLMSGKSPVEASGELKKLLPESWKPEAERIFEEIRRAASEFNPVEIIE